MKNLLVVKLPNVYKDLLKQLDGFSIDGGLIIYVTEDLVERNETLEVAEYATGYISIGDDVGENIFFDAARCKYNRSVCCRFGRYEPT